MTTSSNIVYALVDPRDGEIRYVGQTTKGVARIRQHATECLLRQEAHTHRVRWIRQLQSLGLGFDHKVLESVADPDELDVVECFWIAQLRGMGARLTNHTVGGEGTRGRVVSEETRRRVSEAQRGERAYWYGKKHAPEVVLKRARSCGARPVVDETGCRFETIAEASRAWGISEDGIRHAVKHSGWTHGHAFAYEGEAFRPKPKRSNAHHIGRKHSPEFIKKRIEGMARARALREAVAVVG